MLGLFVDEVVGRALSRAEADFEGVALGMDVGDAVGVKVGSFVGATLGFLLLQSILQVEGQLMVTYSFAQNFRRRDASDPIHWHVFESSLLT